jgi:transposase-like protein
MADTTNLVEGLHSVRRKFADKRLNFPTSYSCRANLALLSTFLNNWQELILKKLNLKVTSKMRQFFEVI